MQELMDTVALWLDNNIVKSVVSVLLALVAGRIIGRLFDSSIAKRKQKSANFGRLEGLLRMLEKVLVYAVYAVAGMQILQNLFGIHPTSLVAVSGAVGVAIGLGAQNVVSDAIAGFFILLEDQYTIGDLITVDGFTGTVMDVGVRVTKISSAAGDILHKNNGQMTSVVNHSRLERTVNIYMPVDRDQNLDEAMDVLRAACKTAKEALPALLDIPSVMGVSSVDAMSVKLRVAGRCAPGEQYGLERAMLGHFKRALLEGGIASPSEHIALRDAIDNQK